ncbi:MAG: YceK/YidQ family lipoprotein, partial [Candidatus Omnitrophota bacterium]
MIRTWLFFCFFILFLSGCSSLAHRTAKETLVSPGIFPGMRTSMEYLIPGAHGLHPELDPYNNSLSLIALVDMPLTFVADTLFFPHDFLEKRP